MKKNNNTVKMIRIMVCRDCGKEFKTERPFVELCDECRNKHRIQANQKKKNRPKEKSKTYLNQLSEIVMFDTKKSNHLYGRSTEDKAIEWHREWLAWADENGVMNTREYEVTKYALDCILKCKKAREDALQQGQVMGA